MFMLRALAVSALHATCPQAEPIAPAAHRLFGLSECRGGDAQGRNLHWPALPVLEWWCLCAQIFALCTKTKIRYFPNSTGLKPFAPECIGEADRLV